MVSNFTGNFFESVAADENISYTDLISYVTSSEPIWTNPYTSSTKALLLNLVKAIFHQADFILLDPNYTPIQVERLLGYSYTPIYKQVSTNNIVKTIEDLIESIQKSNSKVTLFTSGTTGQPRMVTHSICGLSRDVRLSTEKEIVWGFAYNPTHMAGIQVLLQALFNKNLLVNLFGLRPDDISSRISKFGITHISATPTFFRLLLSVNQSFKSVKRVTLGGEKSSNELITSIRVLFPNAKINNIYASTEAGALFASSGGGFTIPEERKKHIKIFNNEIYIHNSLIAESIAGSDEWYATGDIVKWLDLEGKVFSIEGRKTEMINVGGMKVNPYEVEAEISKCPGINQVLVYGTKNSVVGNILCADIVLNTNEVFNEIEMKVFLKKSLQPHMIPRKYQIVDRIELSRTGKTKRK